MEAKPKKKRGRPKLLAGGRTDSLHVRVSPEEKSIIQEAAEISGVSVTTFIVATAREVVAAQLAR